MAKLPPPPADRPTVQAIYRSYEALAAAEPRRRYLGAAQIGEPCDRALWYSVRHCGGKQFDGRMLRLFEHCDQE